MECLFNYIIGMLTGIIFLCIIFLIKHKNEKISGIIFVDEKNDLCKINILSKNLANKKVKEAIFLVAHETDLSREEQIL